MFECRFCQKTLSSSNSLRSHESRCKLSDGSSRRRKTEWSDEMRAKHSQIMIERNTNGSRQYDEAKLQLLSEKAKAFNQKYWTDDRRKQHSEQQKEFVKKNPHLYNRMAGRAKVYEVLNLDGVLLKVRGSWEKKYVEWCTVNNIRCTAPNQPFPYEFEGNEHSYFPDFYLPDLDLWIEVKGFEVAKDRAKWAAFPHELKIIRKNDIKLIAGL